MKKIFNFLLITTTFLGMLWSCEPETDDITITPVSKTMLSVLQENPTRYSTLIAAATRASINNDLVNLLNTAVTDSITLYAPTNAAFNTFLTANGFANLEAIPTDLLRQVILYHVFSGKAQYSISGAGLTPNPIPASVLSGGLSTMRNNVDPVGATASNQIYLNRRGFGGGIGTIDAVNGYARFVAGAFNLRTANGVIHTVDRVLLPPSQNTYQILSSKSQFSLLVYAINRSTTIKNRLESLTEANSVLAPNNAAMTAAGLGDNAAIDAVALADLETILNRHLISTRNSTNDIINQSTNTTGRTINTRGTQLFVSPNITDTRDVRINNSVILKNPNDNARRGVNSDLLGYNGFVHEIEGVIPVAIAPSVPTGFVGFLEADALETTPKFTFLRQALLTTGLIFSGATNPTLGQVPIGVIWQDEKVASTTPLVLANAVPNAPGSSNVAATGVNYTVNAFGGPYTLFAPTNAAFIAAGYASTDAIANLDAAGKQKLREILRYHVLPVRRYYTDFGNGANNSLLWNNITFVPPAAFNINNLPSVPTNYRQITIGVAGGTFTVKDAKGNVVSIPAANRDILAGGNTGGVIHVVDKVLLF
jgi:uncharacterized surface protein with fasciclin (FAS1) repeats